MLASHCAEWALTGRLVMGVFQTLSDGNIGQFGAPGTGVPADATVPSAIEPASVSSAAATAAALSTRGEMQRLHSIPLSCRTVATILAPSREERVVARRIVSSVR